MYGDSSILRFHALILLPHPYRATLLLPTATATATVNIIGQTIVQSIPEP